MQTLVLRIPEELAATLEEEARRLKSTKSEIARARLAATREEARATEAGFALISGLIGAEKRGPADVSARKKHYLKARGYGRKKPRR